MVEMKYEKAKAVFDNINDFFSNLTIKNRKGPLQDHFERMLYRIVWRQKILRESFTDVEVLEDYIKKHKLYKNVSKRIKFVVATKSDAIKNVFEKKEKVKIKSDDEILKFHALVQQNYIDVGKIFPEVPEFYNLCDIKRFAIWYQKQLSDYDNLTDEQRAILEAIRVHFESKIEFIHNRWLAITGKPLQWNKPPLLQELDYWKATIPLYPSWSKELYSLEALKMHHSPALRECDYHNTLDEEEIEQAREIQESDGMSGARTEPPLTDDDGDDSLEVVDSSCLDCSIDKIFDIAGAKKPEQPGPDDKLYTFPGTLNVHENIFYDYSLIIPVEDCGPCSSEVIGPIPRNLLAAKILVGKAKTVLSFLNDVGLSQVLGHFRDPPPSGPSRKVVEEIDDLLNDILELTDADSVSKILSERKKLKEMAGLMRLISRTEMFLTALGGVDPRQYLEALEKALTEFPRYGWTTTKMATHADEGRTRSTLFFPDDAMVPDAHAGGTFDTDWKWRWDEEQIPLRDYLEWLGDTFKNKLDSLFNSATDMKSAVRQFEGNYQKFRSDFERMASGIVNNAAISLSNIIDEIADLISLAKSEKAEGSKRLGLQVVFRQNWFPDGYVMGKLVGYKNLIPNQKEILKRRTFVKTTKEMTTTEEFATARQDDYSHSSKETSEIVKEMAGDFNLTTNASGHYNMGVWGVEGSIETGLTLSHASKTTQNMMSEVVMKSSAKYSEKREVKIRELTEIEDVQEVTSELQNSNQEITANYFYYQLLRQYIVTIELNDLRPVLLRTRDVPSSAEIDDYFISRYIHVLLHYLPAQLSLEAQETAGELNILAKTLIRRRAEMDQRSAEFELFKDKDVPPPEEMAELNKWREEFRSKERILSEARQLFIEAEEMYYRARTRMDRVISHVRENICYYMQFIWQSSPKVDQNKILREEEFCGERLPDVTRGLIRQGYYGNEEIYDYTGQSIALFDLIISNLTPGSEIASLPEEQLKETTLFQYLERYYPEEAETLIEQIRNAAFVTDPVNSEEVLNTRSVQIAQDALVVETMPGQVPLLEGFQMAHRMLDVQQSCLENLHLCERIKGKTWEKACEDSYAVRRYEGYGPENTEVHED